jgi:hypothetical protein
MSDDAEGEEESVGEDFHHVIVQAILHAADLSNPTLDFDVGGCLRTSTPIRPNQPTSTHRTTQFSQPRHTDPPV